MIPLIDWLASSPARTFPAEIRLPCNSHHDGWNCTPNAISQQIWSTHIRIWKANPTPYSIMLPVDGSHKPLIALPLRLKFWRLKYRKGIILLAGSARQELRMMVWLTAWHCVTKNHAVLNLNRRARTGATVGGRRPCTTWSNF